jgi:thiol-disulfide isomerase/thioredoxin
MGMDEVFVYLVENYYMKGDAFWLHGDELTGYIDRAQKIAPNVIGNVAPPVKLPGVFSLKSESMLDLKANFTLLVFYAPSCGHCQKELASIDSLYRTVLKAKGVKVYTVATEGDNKAVTDFINKYKLEEFTNTWDPAREGDWKAKYDVYSTPTIYLLDEKKIIRGKRLDHTNITGLVNMLEKTTKNNTKTK